MSKQVKIGLCGVNGYAGRELIQLINQHPQLKLAALFVRNVEQVSTSAYPLYPVESITEQAEALDVLLLATPPQVSMQLVSELVDSKLHIIDLSGAFRLSAEEFEQWYGAIHDLPQLLADAQYGLSPWSEREARHHHVIANPGCYATCALMALIPLLKQQVISNQSIIIDAKSGASGAGKKTNADLMFCEMFENFFPYKVGKHQHTPEINNALKAFAGQDCDFLFTTQILPITRGIAVSIYADAAEYLTDQASIVQAITNSYQQAYQHYPLVEFSSLDQDDRLRNKQLLSLKSVVGSAKTHIVTSVQGRKVLIFAYIDNLLKGAASQAIENINALYQWPLATGLLSKEAVL